MSTTYVGLDYLDWSAGGGHHFTGHLTFEHRNRVELERNISAREAKILYPDHSDHFYYLPIAKRTNRFETKKSLDQTAIKWCERNLTAPWLIINHNYWSLYRVIGSQGIPETRIRMLNLIANRWDQLDNLARDRETMEAFYRAWEAWKP